MSKLASILGGNATAAVAAGAVIVAGGVGVYFKDTLLGTPQAPEPSAGVSEPVASDPAMSSPATHDAPSFDIVRVAPDGGLTLAGEGRAGVPLELVLDGEVLATLTPGVDGSFAHLGQLPASDTARVLSLREADSGVLGASEFVVAPVLTVTAEPATASMPAKIVASTPQAVVQITKQGAKLVQPVAAPELISDVALDAITYTEQGDVRLSGRAPIKEGDGFVRVYLDNKPVKTQPVADTGLWRTELPNIDAGVYTLRVDQVDASGAVTSRVETPFKREEPAKLETAQVSAITVQPGATLWAIAAERFGNGTQYVQLYEANKDRIRDPDLIYPGQVFDLPTE